MREFYQAVFGVLFIFSLAGLFPAFVEDRPNDTNFLLHNSPWKWRIPVIAGSAGAVSLAVLIAMQLQRDKAPDFLHAHARKYCDSNGFCYTFGSRIEAGVCMLTILFQNRYDRPVQARLALRPAQGFLTRAKIPTLGMDIACPPAGFGIAMVPFGVPEKYQGTTQKFEIGANAHYPQGKGHQLRFRAAIPVRAGVTFKDPFVGALTGAALLGGAVLISSPATVRIRLPAGVAESVDAQPEVSIQILWQLGDPIPADLASSPKRQHA